MHLRRDRADVAQQVLGDRAALALQRLALELLVDDAPVQVQEAERLEAVGHRLAQLVVFDSSLVGVTPLPANDPMFIKYRAQFQRAFALAERDFRAAVPFARKARRVVVRGANGSTFFVGEP